jgi:hypothetical protein
VSGFEDNPLTESAPPCPCDELTAALSAARESVIKAGGTEQDVRQVQAAVYDPNCPGQVLPPDYPCGGKEWVCGRTDGRNLVRIATALTINSTLGNSTLGVEDIKSLFE